MSNYGPEPFDFSEPETRRLRKAAERSFWYGLRNAGWTDEQIHNGLRTYRNFVRAEAAEKIRAVGIGHWEGMSDVARTIRGTRSACADLIDPHVCQEIYPEVPQ